MVVDWGWVLELRERLLGLRLEDLESSLLLKIGGTVKIERERFIEGVEETSKLTLRVLDNECGDRERRPACHSPDRQTLLPRGSRRCSIRTQLSFLPFKTTDIDIDIDLLLYEEATTDANTGRRLSYLPWIAVCKLRARAGAGRFNCQGHPVDVRVKYFTTLLVLTAYLPVSICAY